MPQHSRYQERIIRNYYQNQDGMALQKLSEHVTDLYLSEGKARQQRWKYVVSALEKLKIPAARIRHLQEKDDPALVAKLVEELMAKQG
jgi:hypothetical protein